MNKNKKYTKINKKKYEKKIYIKNLNIKDLKHNILDILKKKFNEIRKQKNYILTNDGVYIFNKDILNHYSYINKTLNETDDFIEINDYYKFNTTVYQIPHDHYFLTILEISFNINNLFLTFEINNNKIQDFYIKTNSSLNILDALMIKEISYIKQLLI